MAEQGMLIVVSGPSGVGKDTIVRLFLDTSPNNVLSVSATTRSPRPGEVHGKDYHFVNRENFEQLISKNEVLEYAEYGGNYYGTPKAEIDSMLKNGKNVILVIEVKGAMQIKKIRPDALLVFLLPPSWADLENRLTIRGTETREAIQARLLAARNELKVADQYDYMIINDTVEECLQRFCTVVEAARWSTKRMQRYLKEVFSHA